MKVTVKLSDLSTLRNEGTVIAATGTADNGDRVTFAGDQRPVME